VTGGTLPARPAFGYPPAGIAREGEELIVVRDEHMPISERWDGWLGSLVKTLDATAASEGLGRCAPVSCAKARDAVVAHLSQPAGRGQFAGLSDPFSFS